MAETTFYGAAREMHKSPLGIISLFLLLVYAIAGIVNVSAILTEQAVGVLVWFLVIFPLAVLAVFAWLVAYHHEKLYGPHDFRDENVYMRLRLAAILGSGANGPIEVDEVVSTIVDLPPKAQLAGKRVLWVDDNPENNALIRQALERAGIVVDIALSTQDGMTRLSGKHGAVITDMGRKEGPSEGYVLLERIREVNGELPVFVYAGSSSEAHNAAVLEKGGNGSTNSAAQLLRWVSQALGNG